jgi:preprotein translocase subunit YajC
LTGRRLSEFGKGDTVCTPTGRFGQVAGFDDGRLELAFPEGDEVSLLPHHVTLIAKAPKHEVPAKFFRDAKLAKGAG